MAKYELRRALNFLGFLATILIAIAILVAGILGWIQNGTFNPSIAGLSFTSIQSGMIFVANFFAYFLAAIAGFSYAKSKRSIWYMVVQIIAVIIILFVIIANLI